MIKNYIVTKLGFKKCYYVNGHDWVILVIIVLEFSFEYT